MKKIAWMKTAFKLQTVSREVKKKKNGCVDLWSVLTLIKEKGGYKFIFNIALANNTLNRFLNVDELIKVTMVCL